jgi:hypothetical protein
MAKTQFEALIEHIINDEEDAARELLHDIVVQTSRQIYNEMAAEDEHEEDEDESEEKVDEGSFGEAGGDMSDDMIDDVEADEEGMSMDDAGDELGNEMGMDDEAGDMEAGEESEDELEDRVVDLEAALDELKAEFDNLMSQEAGEEEHSDMDMGGDDMDMDMGGDDMGAPMGMPKEGMVREYVEKVKAPSNTEGQTVGTGSSDKPSVNSKSIVDNMKNDMGGTVKNLVQGGAESAPDGNSAYKKPSNAYTKGQGEIEVARRSVNQPGGNKGASDFYGTKAKAPKNSETSGTNDKSILKKI